MSPEQLIEIASGALKNAHAPYSGYKVGAALLCSDGTVFNGCNVENASYGLTNCAERTALFSAIAAGRSDFTAMAVSASGGPVPYPCGACRQVLAEFCGPDFTLHVNASDGGESITLGELLPHGFSLEHPHE